MKKNIIAILVALAALAPAPLQAGAAKVPYRVLYNSDTTHILSCTSEWRKNREPLSAAMLQATVNEAADAGVDAFMMAPGLGWVPWWPSKVLPVEKQTEWFKNRFNLPKARNAFLDFILEGNDIVKISLDACKKRGMPFFISFRVNDQHGKDTFAAQPAVNHILTIPAFYAENPQYLIGKQRGQAGWAQYLQDWAHPEVRDYKLSLIKELCANYDIDGFELDFMRAPFFFRLDDTTSVKRREIMLSFIREVRHVLDSTAKPGTHRWLCVRIPSSMACHDAMGVDVAGWQKAGVEMFELSAFYDSEQTTDFAAIRAQAPDAAFYPELTYSTAFNANTSARSHRRATGQYLDTTAHLAYTQGAQGVMLFNFQYYRDNRGRGAGESDVPYSEPLFDRIKALGQPEVVAARPQYYYLGMILQSDPRRTFQLPKSIAPKAEIVFDMDMAAPAGGWKSDGRLRIQGAASLESAAFTVCFNGVEIKPTEDVSEPYTSIYKQMVGAPAELQAWIVPQTAMESGRNRITVRMQSGEPSKLIAVDLKVE